MLLSTVVDVISSVATLSLAIMTYKTLKKISLQARYDRSVKEMENLVAPLFANIMQTYGDEFIQVYSNRKDTGDDTANEIGIKFLYGIHRNKHLGASYLRNSLNNYFKNDPYCAGHTPSAEFKEAEKILIDATKRRYSELNAELAELEKELGSP